MSDWENALSRLFLQITNGNGSRYDLERLNTFFTNELLAEKTRTLKEIEGRIKGMGKVLPEKYMLMDKFLRTEWEITFQKFYNDNERGGSSRWLVAPNIVELFISSTLAEARKETVKEIKGRLLAIIFKLTEEQQTRCGDGTGKITSHSINCKCSEIQYSRDLFDSALSDILSVQY